MGVKPAETDKKKKKKREEKEGKVQKRKHTKTKRNHIPYRLISLSLYIIINIYNNV